MLLSLNGLAVWKLVQNGHFLAPAREMSISSINIMIWVVAFNVIAVPVLSVVIGRLWYLIQRELRPRGV